QSAGASSAVMLFSLDGVARDTLRGGALVSLGGYLGAAVGIFFTLAVLPNMAGIIRLRSNRAPSLPGDIGAAPESAMRLILRAAAGFLLVFPIVMTVGWVSSIAARRLTGETLDPLAHKTLRLLSDADTSADGGVWWWATVLCVLLGAPIVEEIVYRGFIQSAIRRAVLWSAETRPRDPLRPPPRRRAAWASILGTSILFASMHLGVVESHALVTLFALSIGFGIACERSGRLATPIVMHVLFNAANLGLSIVA
ncbi:MAG: CPBP family intramembrane metalloprotease, partial [Phycisphaerae bacterium]|nr:CPBP family intramembrane metalloprotease [Phycisphaerae bacterium]